jgi:hypothetical protein
MALPFRLTKDVVLPNDATERPAGILVPDDPGPPTALVEGVVAKGQIMRRLLAALTFANPGVTIGNPGVGIISTTASLIG